MREVGAVSHRHPLAPVAMAEGWPVLHYAAGHQHDVLKPVADHVSPPDALVGEDDIGELLEWPTVDPSGVLERPAGLRVIEEALEASVGADNVDPAVTGQVDKPNILILQIEGRSQLVGT